MREVFHRVRVFVFQLDERQPNYLLLRSSRGKESFWTPVHGPIGYGEKLETAIRRAVVDELGLLRPAELIDLQMPARWLLGDEETIEWNFGFRTQPSSEGLHIAADHWRDFRWLQFGEAYPSLELENDRAAIMRLHALLSA